MFGNIWKAHYSSPWQNNFINGIQIYNQSPWFKPIVIYLSKAQFSLATSKSNSHWQYQNPVLASNISNPILIGNIKAQFSLAISKPSSRWQYLKPNLHRQYQNPILISNIKSLTYVGTIKKPKLITWHYFIENPRLSILGKILHHNYFT